MKILCVGGGPAGLYFAILVKQRDPSHDISVFERNRPDDTFGFGVVFSESALSFLQYEDQVIYQQINRHCRAWDPIEVRLKDQALYCSGNCFSAISRKRLLTILQARAAALDINVRYSTEFDNLSLLKDYDLVVAADGVNSLLRRTFAEQFQPTVQVGTAKYIWFGTTKMFDALTFLFEENEHGLFGVHAYPYDKQTLLGHSCPALDRVLPGCGGNRPRRDAQSPTVVPICARLVSRKAPLLCISRAPGILLPDR